MSSAAQLLERVERATTWQQLALVIVVVGLLFVLFLGGAILQGIRHGERLDRDQ